MKRIVEATAEEEKEEAMAGMQGIRKKKKL